MSVANIQPINVLVIVSSLCFGGAEKHLIALLNYLDLAYFSLSLIYLKPEEALLPQLDQRRCTNGISCCNVTRKVDWLAVRKLAKHIRDHEVDLVMCVNAYPMLYAWLARSLSRRNPVIVEVFHSTEPGTFNERLQMLFYRPFFRASKLLIYVCENQRSYWRARGLRARRDIVIYNGIDVERFADCWTTEEKTELRKRFGFAPTDYVVGLCAAMRPEKSHGDLLTAVARLRADGTIIKCLLIGDGPERVHIEDQIRTMGLPEHIRITGFLEDVRPAIAACDVMALVSHHESFSIAALEAMAMGKPMVMTKIGGAGEQVIESETGFLYPPGDISALMWTLKKLESAEARGRMGRQAREKVVSDFSLDTMVRKYESALLDLVSRDTCG